MAGRKKTRQNLSANPITIAAFGPAAASLLKELDQCLKAPKTWSHDYGVKLIAEPKARGLWQPDRERSPYPSLFTLS